MKKGGWEKSRLFYALCLLLSLVVIVSLIQIGRDMAATRQIRRVNAQVQEVMEAQEQDPEEEESALAATGDSERVFSSPETIVFATPAPRAEATETESGEAAPIRVYQTTEGPLRVDIAKLRQENPECVGWLRIPEVVDLPVMYREQDNFYEFHDFYGQDSLGGALFLDTMHPLAAGNQHLVIHGHNMKDGTMFGHLVHYEQEAYLKQHAALTWITPWQKELYQIFCVAVVSPDAGNERYLNYLGPVTFPDEQAMRDWLNRLWALSLHWREQPFSLGDSFLTLSTCVGDDRLLVIGRRIDY